MQEYSSTPQPSPSKTSCHDSKSFFKPPPPKPYMQEYSSTSQPPLVTIPSHFLNLPPKTLHARVFLNFTASPLQDFLLDSKSFSTPPPQNPTCKSMPQLHRLPPPRVLVTIPSHFLNLPPQNLTCKSMSQLHSLPSPKLLVTIPSHFLNLPPKTFTCKSMPQRHSFTSPSLLVKIPSHFLNLPPKTFTCKSMPQRHSFTSPSLLVKIPSHFLTLPPQNPTCKSSYGLGGGSGCSWIGAPVQRKKKHADSCGFIRDYRFHRTRSIWLPTETCHFADNMVTE